MLKVNEYILWSDRRFPEFWAQTRKQDFDQDQGWNTIDEQPVYSQQEYAEFEHRRQMEIQQMIDQGLVNHIVSNSS